MAQSQHDARFANWGHMPTPKEYYCDIDKDLEKKILDEALIIPLFEREVYQFKQKKAVSLVTNQFLRCRWKEFLMRTDDQKFIFHCPTIDDLHFRNYSIRYLPGESINNRVDNRLYLRVGPGVDKFGPIPIPDDMHVRKTVYIKPRDKSIEKKVAARKKKNDS